MLEHVLNKNNKLVVSTIDGKHIEVSLAMVGLKNVKLGFVDNSKATVYRKELWQDIKAGKARTGWL